MKEPVAIFLAEYLGHACQDWLDAGYECWLVDPKHFPGIHKKGQKVCAGLTMLEAAQALTELIHSGRVRFVCGFPPCTELTCAGTRHWGFKRKKDPHFQAKAAIHVEQARMIGILSGAPWMIENPMYGIAASIIGDRSFSFDPFEYGGYLPEADEHPQYPDIYPPRDAYPKATNIWCGNGFVIPEKRPVPNIADDFPGFKKLGGKSEKTKEIRSATPRGFARAVFEANAKTVPVAPREKNQGNARDTE